MVKSTKNWIWVVPILLFVVLVSSRFLNADLIYNDEYHSLRHTGFFESRFTVTESLNSVITTSPEHAPFYFLVLNEWVRTVGIHPITARSLSILIMVLAVTAVYRFSSTLINRQAGLTSAFFLGVSGLGIFYAHEVRMYGFLILLVSSLLTVYWQIISSQNKIRARHWMGLYLLSVMLIYTHYFGIFVLLGIGVYHLLFVAKTRRWWQVVGIELIAGVSFLPWLQVVIAGFSEAQTENIADAITQNPIELIYNILFAQSNGLFIFVLILSIASLGLRRSRLSQLKYGWTILSISLITMYITSQFLPILPVRRIRYTMMLAPLLLLIWSMGLAYVSQWKKVLGSLVLVGWFGTFIVFSNSDYLGLYTNRTHFRFDEYPPYQRIQPAIASFDGQHAPVLTLHPKVNVILIDDFYKLWMDRKFFHLRDKREAESVRQLADVLVESNAFWLVSQPNVQDVMAYDFYDAYLVDYAQPCLTLLDESDLKIEYYLKQPIPCELVTSVNPIEYENGMHLQNSNLRSTDDGDYELDMWWVQNGVPDESVGFAIQIFDGEMNKIYQSDHVVQRESIASYPIELDEAVDDGKYSVFVILYSSDTYDSVSGRSATASTYERMNRIATVNIGILPQDG
jgi:hypothetical protein